MAFIHGSSVTVRRKLLTFIITAFTAFWHGKTIHCSRLLRSLPIHLFARLLSLA